MTIVFDAGKEDIAALLETQVRTFLDDNKLKPPRTSLKDPPGYNSGKGTKFYWEERHIKI